MSERNCECCGLPLGPGTTGGEYLSRQHEYSCRESVRAALAAAKLRGWREGTEAAADYLGTYAAWGPRHDSIRSDMDALAEEILLLPEPDYTNEESA